MNKLNLKIEYIYHSGFTVESKNHFLVFDYYKGDLPLSNKKTTFFVSHGHEDHFNPAIFNIKDKANYVLSDDIKLDKNVHFVYPGSNIKLDGMDIKVFGSTDLGVSFLVSLDGINIFHAGDLNWWYWEDDSDEEKLRMEREFKAEINKLKDFNIDLGFFPVDPRLKSGYSKGGEYFIKELCPKYFIPMHFGDKFDISSKFIHKMKDFSTKVVEIKEVNQIIHL